MQLAAWLHRTTPDHNPPGKVTPFRLLFGRDSRTQVDAATPTPDGENLAVYTPSSLTAVKPFTGYKRSAMFCSTATNRDRSECAELLLLRSSLITSDPQDFAMTLTTSMLTSYGAWSWD